MTSFIVSGTNAETETEIEASLARWIVDGVLFHLLRPPAAKAAPLSCSQSTKLSYPLEGIRPLRAARSPL